MRALALRVAVLLPGLGSSLPYLAYKDAPRVIVRFVVFLSPGVVSCNGVVFLREGSYLRPITALT